MGSEIKVAIVTPIHNRREITLQCLRSLARTDQKGLDVSIYIVDDGSTDGSSEAISREFPDVRLIRGDGNLWFTEGTNVGIRAAMADRPDYVLAINDDSVFDTFFLQRLVATADAYPRSVVGPLLLLWDEPHRLFQTAPVWKTLAGGWKHWQRQTVWTVPDAAWEVEIIVGNCVLIPAEAVRECGVMDSKRFPNFGDAEYTPRLKKAGFKLIIEPEARVFCQPNAIPQRLRDKKAATLVRELLFDMKSPSNLTRMFLSHIRGGPSPFKGFVAFGVLLARTTIQALKPRDASQPTTHEPPLARVFAANVLARK
ncbi:MAG TPA: glycosyltransferase family 2 protein [Pyrinomonadaceae bacterium]